MPFAKDSIGKQISSVITILPLGRKLADKGRRALRIFHHEAISTSSVLKCVPKRLGAGAKSVLIASTLDSKPFCVVSSSCTSRAHCPSLVLLSSFGAPSKSFADFKHA